MRGRCGLLMRRAAYWAPAVVAAALLVGGIGAVWTHSLPARAGAGIRQAPAVNAPGSWARLADSPDPFSSNLLLLHDGRVMIADAFSNVGANLYNPVTDSWSETSPDHKALGGRMATLLQNGDVLFAGGSNYYFGYVVADTDIYDPATDTWTAAPPMNVAREGSGIATLRSGKVLVVGGEDFGSGNPDTIYASVEVYDPAKNTWSYVASMAHPRCVPAVVPLMDGRVFVVGGMSPPIKSTTPLAADALCSPSYGEPNPTAEIYDPIKNVWSSAGGLPEGRVDLTATLLPTGKVLVAGGFVGPLGSSTTPAKTNWLYDPATNSWTQAATMSQQRGGQSAILLSTGQVLVAGGVNQVELSTAEIYDPGSNAWIQAPTMPVPHWDSGVVLLADGRVFLNGRNNRGPGTQQPPRGIPQQPVDLGEEDVDAFSTVPGLPGGVKASAGNGSAKVTWTAAVPDGSPIHRYTVTVSPGGQHVSVAGTATSATFVGLTNGTRYTFTVTATNAYGDSPASAPSNAVTPSAPPTPTPTPDGSGGGNGNGNGGGPTGQTGATPTATSAPAATDTPVPQTVANNPPPGPPNNANRSTGGSPPVLLLGLLVLLILLLGGGAVFVFARRGGNSGGSGGIGTGSGT